MSLVQRDFDLHLLYAALDEKRESLALSWSGVARDIASRYTRVSPSTIKGIRDKQIVEGDGVLQMLLWLERSPESFVPGLGDSPDWLLDAPAVGKVLRWDTGSMYGRLNAKREAAGMSWSDASEQIGCYSSGMLQRLKQGGRTSFPGVMRITRWLEVPAKLLTKETDW